ncbi:MAG TPA: hypothetical protein VGB97_00890 [Candidatus Paceibacterota bacterium]|jgi:hypothetical protein
MRHEILPHLWLLVKPCIASALLGLTWYFVFFKNGIHFAKGDMSVFTDAGIPVLAAFHTFMAAFVVSKVWKEHTEITMFCRSKDYEGFRRIIDNRIPMTIHLLLGTLALIIQLLVMLLDYERADAGIALTCSVSFVLVLYWQVATNLDDPSAGVWYVKHIPPSWLNGEEEEKRSS